MNPASGAATAIQNRIFVGFHAYKENVYLARSIVDQAADRWNLPRHVVDDAKSIIGELAVNAVQAAPGHSIGAWIVRDEAHGWVEISVWDPNPEVPKRQAIDLMSERGRGLLIVEAFATAGCGVRPGAGSGTGGKYVWARLKL